MTQGKEISSVKNSIQTRLSGVMLLVLVFALGINVFIFKQIHTAVTRIDAVFSSNTAVNELSESLEQVESTVYEYLNTKSTQALENYYRYEQNYKNLIEELNDRNLDNEVKMLEKNIRRMSESYLEQTNETVQAKRGRNVEKYVYNEQIRNKLRTQYNIHKELVIGHVGGFFEQKNHKFLLMILHEILKIEPQAHFFLIGDGPLKKKIEYQARDLNEHITFTGTTDRVTDYLQMMDGMLLPSLFEGLPLVAIEWQINGLPCILSDTITKDCVFMDNVRFKSLNDSAKEWAQNIIQMIRDNDRINSSINAQKKIVQVGFDIKQGAKQLRSIYIENE